MHVFIPFLEKMYLKKSSPFLYWFFNISINVFLSIKYAPPFHCMWTNLHITQIWKKTWINTTFHISTFLAILVLRIRFFVYIFYSINYITSEATSPQRPSDIYIFVTWGCQGPPVSDKLLLYTCIQFYTVLY